MRVNTSGSAPSGSSVPARPSSTDAGSLAPMSGSINEEDATVQAVKRASPAVVSIIITKELQAMSPSADTFPFDNFFFDFSSPFGGGPFSLRPHAPSQPPPSSGKRQLREVGGGSGFLISADGLVLTNKHVVSDESAEYTVITNDGKRSSATVVGRDPTNDIAFVKIKGSNFPVLSLGDSSALKIGQTVIAIGNSLSQYRNTVTKGVISGIGRRVVAGDSTGSSEVLEEAIQTDAAINPGNSGGPLVNLNGQVVGMNTAINQGGQLIGFAIPVNAIKPVIESVKHTGRIVRPWLGVRYVLLNEAVSKENNLPVSDGALVLRGDQRTDLAVISGSPAEKAGIVENDIIVSVNAVHIDAQHSLAYEVAKYQPGDTVKLKILRKGSEKTMSVTLEEFKNQ